MVRGINGNAEESIYTYNGLGALMEQTWIIAKNGYGYHDVSATAVVDGEVVVDSVTGKRQQKVRLTPEELEAANAAAEAAEAASAETGITETSADANTLTATLVTYGNAANGNNGNNGNSGNGNGTQDKPTGSDVKNTSTVVKQFVVDFSSETYKPLMEHEVNGLDYRYVYSDKARLSVVVQGIETGSASLLDDAGELHAYYHCDYLGTTDYLTSAVNSKVISWTSYNEWGEITHNAVLKCGQRELDLVKEYATHDFDAVLNMYYAKARFYDADNRRFTAVDPILDPSQYDLREYVTDPMQLVQYLYVKDNAVNWIDPLGLEVAVVNIMGSKLTTTVDTNNAKSTVEMLNLYTFAKADAQWKKYSISAYSYDSGNISTLTDWQNASVGSILEATDFTDATGQRKPVGNYFQKYYCEDDQMYHYTIHMPEYGSTEYLGMVNQLIRYTNKDSMPIYSDMSQRIMRDVNNAKNLSRISDDNFSALGIYYSDLIVKQGVPSKEEHYFRNKLNRVPLTLDVLELQASDWYLLTPGNSVYHMNQEETDSGLYNVKFVHKDGHYEAVYNVNTKKLVTSDINMGTYNYDGSYLNKSVLAGGGHLQYDMIPYYFYGNTSNDPLKKFASINASDDNRDRYDEIKDDRENLIMKKRIEFINEWKAAGGLFEEKYYTEGLL